MRPALLIVAALTRVSTPSIKPLAVLVSVPDAFRITVWPLISPELVRLPVFAVRVWPALRVPLLVRLAVLSVRLFCADSKPVLLKSPAMFNVTLLAEATVPPSDWLLVERTTALSPTRRPPVLVKVAAATDRLRLAVIAPLVLLSTAAVSVASVAARTTPPLLSMDAAAMLMLAASIVAATPPCMRLSRLASVSVRSPFAVICPDLLSSAPVLIARLPRVPMLPPMLVRLAAVIVLFAFETIWPAWPPAALLSRLPATVSVWLPLLAMKPARLSMLPALRLSVPPATMPPPVPLLVLVSAWPCESMRRLAPACSKP